MDIHDEGSATSMSIDKEKQRIVVSVRDKSIANQSSSWGFIYHFKVNHQAGQAPKMVQQGEPLDLGESNSGVYDLKMARIPKYKNHLIVLASIFTHETGKKQLRLFYVNETSNNMYEILNIPELADSRPLTDIKQFEEFFVIGCFEGNKLAHISFK